LHLSNKSGGVLLQSNENYHAISRNLAPYSVFRESTLDF
jgi:hypothetical protein